MGEFGFITADDVYHVTVYATDEDGNFKIISMKNIKLFKMPSTTSTTPAPTTSTPKPFRVITTPASSEIACAGCKIPDKENGNGKPITPTEVSQTTTSKEGNPAKNPTAPAPTPFKIVKPPSKTDLPQKIVDSNSIETPADRQNPTKSPQAEIYNKASFDKSNQKLQGPLYRFNYTTDFFGHHEEGDRAGNKDGGYFSVGRDNQRRIVTYKANEFGYQPYVKSELVRPEELQTYDEKNNRLKGYKFEWFHAN